MVRYSSSLSVAALCMAMLLPAGATPIRPDIRKLVAEPGQESMQFAPARAGWNGPEAATQQAQFANPAVERLSPAATAREVRASMLAILMPDWRIASAILVLIVLMRVSRRKRVSEAPTEMLTASNTVVPEERLKPAA